MKNTKNSLIKQKYQLKKNLIVLFVNNKNLVKLSKKFDKNNKKKNYYSKDLII